MNIREQYANVSHLLKTKNLESFENNFVPFLRWQGIPEIGFNSSFKKSKFYLSCYQAVYIQRRMFLISEFQP